MLRTSIYPKNFKQEFKKQRSQEPKHLRSRKNNSPSPVYKQININKENIHPNKYQLPPSPQIDHQPALPSAFQNNLHPHLHQTSSVSTAKYRQKYYNIKQNVLREKIQKNKQQILSPKLSSSFLFNKVPRQIDNKVKNRSLEKCQIHPDNNWVRAEFLIQKYNNGDQDEVLCCYDCATGYKNKITLEKITNTVVAPGITVSQYFNILQSKMEKLDIAKQNLQGYTKQFRTMSSMQSQKHRKYYNTILESIQNAMKQSEEIVAKYVNEGESALLIKRQQIEKQIRLTKIQLNKMLTFQQKQLNYPLSPYHKDTKFCPETVLKDIDLQVDIPLFFIYNEIQGLLKEFQAQFIHRFSIKILTKQQLEQKIQSERQKKYQKERERGEKDRKLSSWSSKLSHPRTTTRNEEEADLFCDEYLGQNKSNKTHEFSFEKSNSGSMHGRNNDCILQLVEEEDVISPVFKAI